MVEDRKASEVLLDLENAVRTLTGLANNTDHNVKLLMDRISRLEQLVVSSPSAPREQPKVLSAQPITVPQQSPVYDEKRQVVRASRPHVSAESPDISPAAKFIGSPVEEQPYELDNYGQPELMEEVVHKGTRRDLRQPADNSQSKKVAVSQRILFPDGKPMFLAGVEVSDGEGNTIARTRTNTQGRWLAPLEAGEYTVHIVKRISPDSKRPPVELKFQVQIPPSSSPVELPSPDLPDVYREESRNRT